MQGVIFQIFRLDLVECGQKAQKKFLIKIPGTPKNQLKNRNKETKN